MTIFLLDGPKTPGFFQSIQVLINPLSTLDMWSKEYGEIFQLRGDSPNPTIVISRPDHIKTVLNTSSEFIESSENDNAMKLLVGGNSMMFANGEKHRQKRKLFMPCFQKQNIIKFGEYISDITQDNLIYLSPYKSFSVRRFTKQITLQVILGFIFGTNKASEHDRLKKLLNSLNELFEFPVFEVFLAFPFLQQKWWIWNDYLQIQKEINEVIYDEIKIRRDNKKINEGILSSLINATDETGRFLTDREIRDELMTLILGGFETTSAALAWLLYWVHHSPEIKQKLIEELANFQEDIDLITVSKLPFLDAVVSETLRLYPIAIGTFSRKVIKAFDLDEYRLEPGTRIHISIYLAHRNHNVYSNPDKFQPERFLERTFSPYEYLPFGGGERRCLGANLAQLEMKMFLVTILKKQITLNIVNQEQLKPVRHGIALVPPPNFEMILNQVY